MHAVCLNAAISRTVQVKLDPEPVFVPEDGICALRYHRSVQSSVVPHNSSVSSHPVGISSSQARCTSHCQVT